MTMESVSRQLSENPGRQPDGKDETTGGAAPLLLRITAGIHTGAERRCRERDMVLLGSGDDCDLVLVDPGIAAHHCLINILGGQILVRAIEAPLTAGGRRVSPGDPVVVDSFQPIALGEARLCLGADWDPRWQATDAVAIAAAESAAPVRKGAIGRHPWYTMAGLALVSLASVALYASNRAADEAGPGADLHISAALAGLNLDEVERQPRADGGTVFRGIVPDEETRVALQQRLAESGQPHELEVRSGDNIASDVAEVLRLSGIAAETRYVGAGRVDITGNFGNGDALREVLASRAMLDIGGLKDVGIANSSEPDVVLPEALPLLRIVKGADPHLVTEDGSRYYIGAALPGGEKLYEIDEDQVWVDVDGRIRRLDPSLLAQRRL
jgi:hypothetical protein